jgi:site-specific recombinase
LPERRAPHTLAAIVDLVRPVSEAGDPGAAVRALIESLRSSPELGQSFNRCLRGTFARLRLVHTLVDGGILTDKGLFSELRARTGGALLPRVHPDDDLRAALPIVFSRDDDWAWVRAVPSADWAAVFELVLDERDVAGLPHEDVGAAIRALAQRIGAAGIDNEINAKLSAVEDYDSPFLDSRSPRTRSSRITAAGMAAPRPSTRSPSARTHAAASSIGCATPRPTAPACD